jgi:hypothetical protein
MKTLVVAIALVVGVIVHAQDQSTCPGPRQHFSTSSCASGDLNRNIRVRVATLDTRHGSNSSAYTPASSGGYASVGSRISPGDMAETVLSVEQHTYRSCDIGLEIVDRVKESFQRLGYFCADVEPIEAQQTGKNEYRIAIHVHPGEQYRVGELTFTGATVFSLDELRSELHIKPNSVFNTESVRRGLENIQKSYARKGLPNVTAIPVASVDETNRKIALEIKIQESVTSQ